MKIAIITSKATSLQNVGKDIAFVLMKKKQIVRLFSYPPSPVNISNIADASIFIYPCNPLFITPYFMMYRDYKQYAGLPSIFYTTVEGQPTTYLIKEWMLRDLEFIANSKYTANKLMEVGFNVIDIIPHGIVKEQVKEAENLVPIVKDELKRKFKDKVIFGCIAFWHKRKGLDLLIEAIKKLNEKRKDFIVYLITNTIPKEVENLYVDCVFGKRSRTEIFAFLGAIDFLIIPSLAEGFCLPLLEANAMGTLAIHCAYPPLTEISDLSSNLAFTFDNVVYEDLDEGIHYEMHYYDTKKLADMMDYAIDMYKNNPQEYEKRCKKVKEIINKFNAEVLYEKFLNYLT